MVPPDAMLGIEPSAGLVSRPSMALLMKDGLAVVFENPRQCVLGECNRRVERMVWIAVSAAEVQRPLLNPERRLILSIEQHELPRRMKTPLCSLYPVMSTWLSTALQHH
jgi:hypothetical protein